MGRRGSSWESLEQPSVGPPSTRAMVHDPPHLLLQHGALDYWFNWQRCGWTWAAPGWILGKLATDGCHWRSLRCLPAPLLALLPFRRAGVEGAVRDHGCWLQSGFRQPSWSEKSHLRCQCGSSPHLSGFWWGHDLSWVP